VPINGQDTIRYKRWFTEKLNKPFGTILTLQVEIFDGEKLNDKMHESSYLFRVTSIDSVLLNKPLIMDFKDETGYFPTEDFELYKYFYGVDTGMLTENDIKKIKRKYVDRNFTVVAYESGQFIGSPNGIGKYQIPTAMAFHFRHYLIVISDLAEGDWHDMKSSLKK